ncbi:MAG: four helix bundle protein [Bacteroidales bacterium]|nr:four helix bundle protein [Bacteroidales bacterium]MBO7571193.1 four helix bundle protein [Bacteroidales bacterium]
MATVSSFEELDIWKQAREICMSVYEITCHENFNNDFRFCSQIRAAAGSIMDNIAEGFEREGNKEFIQFLFYAKGSCGELRSQLIRACDWKYITNEEFNKLKEDASKISTGIYNFIKYLKNSNFSGNRFK